MFPAACCDVVQPRHALSRACHLDSSSFVIPFLWKTCALLNIQCRATRIHAGPGPRSDCPHCRTPFVQVTGLESLSKIMCIEVLELRRERDRAVASRTVTGHITNVLGYCLSIFCVLRCCSLHTA